MNIVVVCCLLSVSLQASASVEIYSAIADLTGMLRTEQALAGHIRHYVKKEHSRLQALERAADEFERHSSEALKEPDAHVSNPVNAYKLIKRLTRDWNYLRQQYLTTSHIEDFTSLLVSMESSFPDYEDLSGAAKALFRLMDTYALNPLHPSLGFSQDGRSSGLGVSGGGSGGGSSGGGSDQAQLFSLHDLFELGLVAFELEQYYHNYLLFNATLSRLPSGEAIKSDLPIKSYQVSNVKLLGYMAYSLFKLNHLHKAYVHTLELLKIDPTIQTGLDNKELLEAALKRRAMEKDTEEEGKVVQRPLDDFKSSEEFADYEKLCRGENLSPPKEAPNEAYCRYQRHHPLFFLKPLKSETIATAPSITLLHDVIRNQRINHIIQLANPKLDRAKVQDTHTGEQWRADYRIGKNAWLSDNEASTKRVSLTTAAFSNLTLDTVEYLQVMNYGIGGHYEPHYDFSTKHQAKDKEMGNRILTCLCYLSDVHAGGATVFPKVGVRISPEKGACALWYNLFRDGGGDLSTWHAACPVLVGNKWVANKWFHERGQEFVRPCSTVPDDGDNDYYDEDVSFDDVKGREEDGKKEEGKEKKEEEDEEKRKKVYSVGKTDDGEESGGDEKGYEDGGNDNASRNNAAIEAVADGGRLQLEFNKY